MVVRILLAFEQQYKPEKNGSHGYGKQIIVNIVLLSVLDFKSFSNKK